MSDEPIERPAKPVTPPAVQAVQPAGGTLKTAIEVEPPALDTKITCEETAEMDAIQAQINQRETNELAMHATYTVFREHILEQCMAFGCRFKMPDYLAIQFKVMDILRAHIEATMAGAKHD